MSEPRYVSCAGCGARLIGPATALVMLAEGRTGLSPPVAGWLTVRLDDGQEHSRPLCEECARDARIGEGE